MPLRKKTRNSVLAGLILLSTTLTGCRTLRVYPIQQTDIYVQDNGDVCFSEQYFKEVLKARIEKF